MIGIELRRRLALTALVLGLLASAGFAQSGALSSSTIGAAPRALTAPSSFDLTIEADFSLGGSVFKDGVPFLHTDGGPDYQNLGVGRNALSSLTPGPGPVAGTYEGWGNTGVGDTALKANTTGICNLGVGAFALANASTGNNNAAFGYSALYYHTDGNGNTAGGTWALLNNTEGHRNLAIGYYAGGYNVTGSHNVWIASYGDSAETGTSNTLRIGGGTGDGRFELNRAFISGIRGITTGAANAIGVVIDGNGQLGTVSSSRRTKENIRDMGAASSRLHDLRPVTFRYKTAFKDGSKPTRYGLIAEEVAEVFPELVAYDLGGKPESVLYHLLDAMLLNEIQKQQRTIARQEAELRATAAELTELRIRQARLEDQEARLRQIVARLARLAGLEIDEAGRAAHAAAR